jgi:ABC-2 type transport system permease protein
MTAWRLEWLRLVRTRRLVALAGVYVFFGFVGPLTARYLGEIIDRFGGDEMTVVVPDPVPADGIIQFASNAAQIGVLVAVAVAAGALVVDALPEMSVFLRTRMPSAGALLLPRLVVTAGAAGAAYLLGVAIAWYETAVLIGGVPAAGMIGGAILGVLYLGFAVALVGAIGARLRSVLGTVGTTVVVLLAMPLLGLVEPVGRFLPSHLVGAQVGLITGEPLGEYLPAAAVTIVAGAALVAAAIRATARREL